jgi:hypothetical protein
MEVNTTPDPEEKKPKGFPIFVAIRVLAGIVIAIALLWGASRVMDFFAKDDAPPRQAYTPAPAPHGDEAAQSMHAAAEPRADARSHADPPARDAHGETPAPRTGADAHGAAPSPAAPGAHGGTEAEKDAAPHGEAHGDGHGSGLVVSDITGVTFVNAVITPLDNEINERLWGWRPNDVVQFTDNVNNYQLGMLETVRRATEALLENISRSGSTQAYNVNLEQARNHIMIDADAYWMPSAENSYQDTLNDLKAFRDQLENGSAVFYTRTANLLPLIRTFEYLLGSCDDNLVKTTEHDGDAVSFFKADDYFYYAKGVVDTMLPMLEAVAVDFEQTIEPRRGSEVLHHAIEALHHAKGVDPLIILNAGSNSLLANHRLNLAGPISHARYYLGLLVETLSM